MPRQPKVQRWTDLLAALLRYRFPVEFSTLRKDVPTYATHRGTNDALMRMFERDKDELRSLGVPIETLAGDDGNVSRYRLASRDFYLPYLTLCAGDAQPARPGGAAYPGLPLLAFEPDELDAVMRAGARVQQIGDPQLAAEARSALRKLAYDLPQVNMPAQREVIATDDVLDAQMFDVLTGAVRKRKRVTFTYFSMGANTTLARTVEPYGIVYLSSHWYLIGRDVSADAVRQFRMTRISDLVRNAAAPATPDFDVAAGFDLWTHARSSQAWELGDAESNVVTVKFTGSRGDVVAAAKLGECVDGDAQVRLFHVRRTEVFCRWILGFAGAARPVAPPALVEEFQRLVQATLAVYAKSERAGDTA